MDIQDIIDRLARILKRPITLEDHSGRLIAYSVHDAPVDSVRLETLLRRGASHETIKTLRDRGVYQYIDSAPGIAAVQAIPEIGFSQRTAAAIRWRGEVLGYLWVAGAVFSESDGDTYDTEQEILNTRNAIAAILANRNSAMMPGQGATARLFQALFRADTNEENMMAEVRASGVPLRFPLQVVVVRRIPGQVKAVCLEGAQEILTGWCEAAGTAPSLEERGLQWRVGVAGGELTILAWGASSTGAILEFAQDVCHKVSSQEDRRGREGDRHVCGVSQPCFSAKWVRRGFSQAVLAVELGTVLHPERVVHDYCDIAPYHLFSSLVERSAQLPPCSFGRDQVESLMEYDESHGTALAKTLETYLDVQGKRREAARLLGIHPNSLDYRLFKIRHVSKVDLSNPGVRLSVHAWIKAVLWARVSDKKSKEPKEVKE